VEKGRAWGEGKRTWWMYFMFMYKNRTMKPVEIVLRGEEDEEEQWRG
jgi:hypothetical protein